MGVEPSLIRVSADPLTYPLHIVLRFELELALVEGDLAVADLPAAWGERVGALLGLEVPSDALGCLQDVHWGIGAFGYFPSYALGCLIAAQLWESMIGELGSVEEDLRRGEVVAIQQLAGRARPPLRPQARHDARWSSAPAAARSRWVPSCATSPRLPAAEGAAREPSQSCDSHPDRPPPLVSQAAWGRLR